MKKFIISVIGQDRPGIIAAVTKVLFDQDLNIEDVSQTILQNQFSGIFIASGPEETSYSELKASLKQETQAFGLHYYVRDMGSNTVEWTTCNCESFIITTRGPDRKGLVANIAALLASFNINVARLQAVFRGGDNPGNNVMIYEVDIPGDVDLRRLRNALHELASELELEINLQHKNIFEAINRI
jgi:glycine cleavage system transcriptional repressor